MRIFLTEAEEKKIDVSGIMKDFKKMVLADDILSFFITDGLFKFEAKAKVVDDGVLGGFSKASAEKFIKEINADEDETMLVLEKHMLEIAKTLNKNYKDYEFVVHTPEFFISFK